MGTPKPPPIPKGVKWRDHLLSAAMRLADDPTKQLAFLEVADQVIENVQEDTERQVQGKPR